MFCLAEYVKALRGCASDPDITAETFLNELLASLVFEYDLKNQNNEEYWINSNRASLLMNRKIDVPSVLRNVLLKTDVRERIIGCFPDFVDGFLEADMLPQCIQSLKESLTSDKRVSAETKARILEHDSTVNEILVDMLLEAIRQNNCFRTSPQYLWRRGNNFVSIETDDLFEYGFGNRNKKENIVVIPVNSSFETHITRNFEKESDPLVSVNTVHGQWLSRIIKSGETEQHLNERISSFLLENGIFPNGKSPAKNGKLDTFPIGTIAVVHEKKAIYFLLVISDFDERNMARSSGPSINTAVTNLLDVYDHCGQGYELYMPLIGTGRSRAGLSPTGIVRFTAECFPGKCHAHTGGHIHLVVTENDMEQINIRKE